MQIKNNYPTGVIVTGNNCINNLGVVRNLGRHGIPVTLLTYSFKDMVRYSRYSRKRVTYPNPQKSEIEFVDFLLDMGKRMDEKPVIIPTNDLEVIALSKYKNDLEQFYLLPLPPFNVIEKLVNKKMFYKLLDQLSIPHPKTYFLEDISELKSIVQKIDYPYIIKPAYSHLFVSVFHKKCFVINSSQELDQVTEKVRNRKLDVMIQKIIPGRELYMFSLYLNKKSEPIAICGYDKLRQYPPDFGCGSFCKSAWRSSPIDSGLKILKSLKYYGIAEPEFKRDPRDGEYKLFEVNARTTTQSLLAASCGVNLEYIAYLDIIGQYTRETVFPTNGILWVDEFCDLLSCFKQWKNGALKFKKIAESLKGKKIFATAAWDDPLPFFVSLSNYCYAGLRRLFLRRK